MKPKTASIATTLVLHLTLSLTFMTQVAAQSPPTLTYDVIFGEDGSGKAPTGLTWTAGILSFLYEDDLWEWRRGAEAVVLVSAADPANGADLANGADPATGDDLNDPKELSLAKHHWSRDGQTLLIESHGDLLSWNRTDRRLRQLTDAVSQDEDPKFSPDGQRISFVRDANLWTLDLRSGTERQLTADGEQDFLMFGKTDWVYWEELWGRDSTGHWWSPDGSSLALYRFDDRQVPRYPLLDSIGLDPKVTQQPYPRAGTTNPSVSVGVLDPKTLNIVWMDTDPGSDHYLARVTWLPDGSRLAIHRLNRAQSQLEVLLCDPLTGTCEVFLEETSSSWIDIEDDFRFLADGRFIHGSDRSGWRSLYLYSKDGKVIRQLTPDGFAVTSLDAVLDDTVVYSGYVGEGLGAKDRHVFKTTLAGSAPEQLTSGEGTHGVLVDDPSGNFVLTASEVNLGRWLGIYDSGVEQIGDLPQAPPELDRDALPKWEFITVPGPDGARLPARLLRPAGRAAGSRHPVIMYHYGGPASQVVADSWQASPVRDLWHMRQAERGYGVLLVDNQASLFFGKAGASKIHRRFGDTELAAQQAAVEFLRDQDWVDPDRIGLWGWSGGGANTLYSLFRSPGTWAAGVAGAPVTDWRLYDSIWTERYMGHPDDNAEGYRQSSPLTWATDLQDHLLVVHGTGDDNVHPNNTLVLSNKLIEAGIPFDQGIYPRQKHGFNPKESRHFYEKMETFFDRWLMATK